MSFMAGLMTRTVDAARGSLRSTRPESFDDFRSRGGIAPPTCVLVRSIASENWAHLQTFRR